MVNELAEEPTVTLSPVGPVDEDQGAAAGSGVTVSTALHADTADRDGSEGITEIQLAFAGVNFDGLLESQFTLTIDGQTVDFDSLNG